MVGINVLFSIVIWSVLSLIVPFKRFKILFPIGFIAAGLLLIVQYIIISVGLIHYTVSVLFIAGMPLFQLVFAFAYSILLLHFMKNEWIKKILIILIFTLINEVIAYALLKLGNLVFINNFNIWIDALITFVSFYFGVSLVEDIWRDRIYAEVREKI